MDNRQLELSGVDDLCRHEGDPRGAVRPSSHSYLVRKAKPLGGGSYVRSWEVSQQAVLPPRAPLRDLSLVWQGASAGSLRPCA